MNTTPHRRGTLLVAAAAICWSSGGLIARLAATDGWTTVFWRSPFCALFLFAVVTLHERASVGPVFRRVGLAGVAMALCFATASTCFVMALGRTSVANVLIIQSTAPFMLETILGPIWVWLAVGESPGPRSLAGGAVVLGALAVHTALDLSRPGPPAAGPGGESR